MHVSQRYGYKNFERALRAYAGSARLSADFDFVTFGGGALSTEERSLFASLGVRPGSVQQTSGPDNSLARAYRSAHALIYPSEYEGFGIPPLEAMTCGCLVVCAAGSSIPVVVGDAGEYFEPSSIESIRNAMETVCYDDDRCSQLVQRGHEQRMRFSWDRYSQETLVAYTSVLSSPAAAKR